MNSSQTFTPDDEYADLYGSDDSDLYGSVVQADVAWVKDVSTLVCNYLEVKRRISIFSLKYNCKNAKISQRKLDQKLKDAAFEEDSEKAKIVLEYGATYFPGLGRFAKINYFSPWAIKIINYPCLDVAWLSLYKDLINIIVLFREIAIEAKLVDDVALLIQALMLRIDCYKSHIIPEIYMKRALQARENFISCKNASELEILALIKKEHSSSLLSWGSIFSGDRFKKNSNSLYAVIEHALFNGGHRTLKALKELEFIAYDKSVHESAPDKFKQAYQLVITTSEKRTDFSIRRS